MYQLKTLKQLLKVYGMELTIIATLIQLEIFFSNDYNARSKIRKWQVVMIKIKDVAGPVVFIAARDKKTLEEIKKGIGTHYIFDGKKLVVV